MIRRHTISVKNAFNGLVYSLKSQPNYKIHLVLSLLAIIGGIIFHVSYLEFLIIVIMISVGLTIETINTAIEQTTDAIDLKWREDIRLAKDLSAAAMLIFAIGALVVAGIIFIPKIFSI